MTLKIQKRPRKRREFHIYNTPVFIKDFFLKDIDMPAVVEVIKQKVPRRVFYGLDAIYVGQFPDIEERNLTALYQNGAIYVSNDQDDEEDLIDDIIHEFAHFLEEYLEDEIYGDYALEEEFLKKRKILLNILREAGYTLDKKPFLSPEYSEDFDDFLYHYVGYEQLATLSAGVFFSPYGATSLKEYWANGFEAYLDGQAKALAKVSPALFNIVDRLIQNYGI